MSAPSFVQRLPVVMVICCVHFCAGLQAASINVTQPPKREQVEEMVNADPGKGAMEITGALAQDFKPAVGGMGSSTSRPAFRAWLYLGTWLDWLSRPDLDCWKDFLTGYLRQTTEAGEPVIVYRTPGMEWQDGVWELPEPMLSEIAADPGMRQKYSAILLPRDFVWRDAPAGIYLGKELALLIATTPGLLEQTVATVSDEDFLPGVFSVLRQIYEKDPVKFVNYYPLALAFAVVFDQSAPTFWPHHQVATSAVPLSGSTVEERFFEFLRANDSRQLVQDPKKMSAQDLVFVVDALVASEELEWARKNVRTVRASFDRVFGSIRYDKARADAGAYSWPSDTSYTLQEIQKSGGICVDQAYFASIAGKAKGIPTLFFVGQGEQGGHAWFGFLRSENRWELDAGRYENQNYFVGKALDPQSWAFVTDHDLKALSANSRTTPAWKASVDDLLAADLFSRAGKEKEALNAMESALRQSPKNPEIWTRLGRELQKDGGDSSRLIAHLQEAAKTFVNDRELRAEFLMSAAALARASGDSGTAEELENQIVGANRRQRADLSITAAAAGLFANLKEGKTGEALQEFRSLATRFGKTGGGNFFYQIVDPLASELISMGNKNEARQVVDLARRHLRPEDGSILDSEIKRLEERVEAMPR